MLSALISVFSAVLAIPSGCLTSLQLGVLLSLVAITSLLTAPVYHWFQASAAQSHSGVYDWLRTWCKHQRGCGIEHGDHGQDTGARATCCESPLKDIESKGQGTQPPLNFGDDLGWVDSWLSATRHHRSAFRHSWQCSLEADNYLGRYTENKTKS
jgi:hypothetical protein